MTGTLIVTNDFPPRQGGIETFVHAMATRLPAGEVVVYTSAEPGAHQHDAALPFPVVRDRSRMLLPTPRVTRRAAEIARAYGCDRVWFGAAAPLAAMTPELRRQAPGIRRTVATTHGHEIWWARTPSPDACCGGSATAWTSSPSSAPTPVNGSPPRSARRPGWNGWSRASTPNCSARGRARRPPTRAHP